MKDKTKKAIDGLSAMPSRRFIPLSHSNALDNYGTFIEHYDPYAIPQGEDEKDREKIENKILYGAIEHLSVTHFDSSEWAEDDSLVFVYSDKYDEYYDESSVVLTENFGEPNLEGKVDDCSSTFKELNKISTGDNTKVKIWQPNGMGKDYFCLVNTMSAGDGDLLFILWLAHITPPDY